MRHPTAWIFGAAVAGLVAMSIMLVGETSRRAAAPDSIPETYPEDDVQVLETSWKDADGVLHTVKTPRQSDETLDAWTARHQAAVAALQAIYPPA